MSRRCTRANGPIGLRTLGAGALALVALSVAGGLTGCESTPKKPVRTTPPAALRDVPALLQGTIGAEAEFRGIEPVLISGLGIVVNLRGTGGGELPVPIKDTMERELARGGIGKGGESSLGDLGPISPQEFLRSPNVAVVIVEAQVPPGAPEGSSFDVYVRTLPGSGVTSLEGGTLWSTDLRIGPAAVFGAVKTRKIGSARGPIFINPFSDPGVSATGEVEVSRTSGRILAGGKVTDPLQIEMVLDTDSHARARSIVQTINTKFPTGPGDEGTTARGRGRTSQSETAPQSVALRVPRSYADRPAEFLQILRHTRVDQAYPQEAARTYVESLKSTPGMSDEISWLLTAVGKPAVPFLPAMYDYSELGPRMAALTAGARLGDARAAGPMLELAKSGPTALRLEALRLLGRMPSNPAINLSLRELVNEPDLEVRVAAYEALRERRDPIVLSVPVGRDTRQPKFTLELVPAKEPLIYVTQQGEPRIVLFGPVEPGSKRGVSRSGTPGGLGLNKPLMVSAWGDRLLMVAESSASDVRVLFRDPTKPQPTQAKAPENLVELVQFLGHESTPDEPRPGLGMSYSEVVGALYEMSRQGAMAAVFATEEDRLKAEIYQASQSTMLADRPEGGEKVENIEVFKPQAPRALPSADGAGTAAKKSRVVPLTKPRTKLE